MGVTPATAGNSTRYVSPLRYPGGKAKLANFIKLLMVENKLVGKSYVEPYAGGASVALTLLLDKFAESVHINDVNRGVFSFWKAVIEDTDELCSLINNVSVTVDEWQRQREIYRSAEACDTALGFATFFLNRTNRSGIIARGSVIGGRKQTGGWKVDARFNRENLVQRIREVARHRSQIMVSGVDAEKVLDQYSASGEALVFLDPPYYVKGPNLYEDTYGHDDHVRIARKVFTLMGPWVVTYDAAPEILSQYDAAQCRQYSLAYSAAARYNGTEMLAVKPGLRVPKCKSPASVKRDDIERRLVRLGGAH